MAWQMRDGNKRMGLGARWTAACAIGWAVAMTTALSGCGAVLDPGSINLGKGEHASEQAMGALAHGDLAKAEDLGNAALSSNRNDPYALLALAIVYQNTGRSELARQYYDVLISMHSQQLVVTTAGAQPRTIDDIARANLSAMGARMVVPSAVAGGGDTVSSDLGFAEDTNVITRFLALRRLLDSGLITQDEYTQRRAANVGGLLQYTAATTPAAGLGRAAPNGDEVIERLKAIATNFKEGSISSEEQALERGIILDALMPAKVSKRADRPASVSDDIQYAAKMGRIQRLVEASLISKDEASRERKALSSQLAAANAQREAMAAMANAVNPNADAVTPSPLTVPKGQGGYGVSLGSYGSKQGAERAWTSISQQFHDLAGIKQNIAKGKDRRHGSSYHLTAGPIGDEEAAKKLCVSMKMYDLPCMPQKMK